MVYYHKAFLFLVSIALQRHIFNQDLDIGEIAYNFISNYSHERHSEST